MKKIFLSLTFLFTLGLQAATAQTWEDAYAVPNMLGDGGLLQPNSIDNSNFTIYNFQQHATKICENNSVIPRDRLGFHFAALQTIPTGIAYAIWSGVGIVLIAAVAWLFQGQKLDAPAMVGMGLIVAGVVVMNVFSKVSAH